jgi:hypothetical protein
VNTSRRAAYPFEPAAKPDRLRRPVRRAEIRADLGKAAAVGVVWRLLSKRRRPKPIRALARGLDNRMRVAAPLRRTLNAVFPDRWSFFLGEIALYTFVVLVLTGT